MYLNHQYSKAFGGFRSHEIVLYGLCNCVKQTYGGANRAHGSHIVVAIQHLSYEL